METCLATPSTQCRFLGTPITQKSPAQAPALIHRFHHHRFHRRSPKWLAFGDHMNSARPVDNVGPNTRQNGYSGQTAYLTKDGWVLMSRDGRLAKGPGEQHTGFGHSGPAQSGGTARQVQESLQSAVWSLQEYSSTLQRVSSGLYDTLLRSDIGPRVENGHHPQSSSDNNFMHTGQQGNTNKNLMQSGQQEYPDNNFMQSGQQEYPDNNFMQSGQQENTPQVTGDQYGDLPQVNTQEYGFAQQNGSAEQNGFAEQNGSAVSEVAFKLQQAFVQARSDFLGKPFQLALEEFVDCTMQAHAMGIDLLTLQLQVLLAERAGYDQDIPEDVQTKVTMEGHIRAMWMRLVYITLNHVAEVRAAKEAGVQNAAQIQIDPAEDLDGQGHFVKGIIDMHLGQGLTLDRLRLQQAYAEKTDSPAVEALQQSHYLILMTLAKALGEY